LRSQVKDYFGLKLAHRSVKPRSIPNVAADIFNDVSNPDGTEKVWIGTRIESVSSDIRAEICKPQSQPPAFEARMSGEKDAASTPEIA
jgi:hypothetical protein